MTKEPTHQGCRGNKHTIQQTKSFWSGTEAVKGSASPVHTAFMLVWCWKPKQSADRLTHTSTSTHQTNRDRDTRSPALHTRSPALHTAVRVNNSSVRSLLPSVEKFRRSRDSLPLQYCWRNSCSWSFWWWRKRLLESCSLPKSPRWTRPRI